MQTHIPRQTIKISVSDDNDEMKWVIMQVRNFCSLCTYRKGNECKGYDEPLYLSGKPVFPTRCELLGIFNKYRFNFTMEDRHNK